MTRVYSTHDGICWFKKEQKKAGTAVRIASDPSSPKQLLDNSLRYLDGTRS